MTIRQRKPKYLGQILFESVERGENLGRYSFREFRFAFVPPKGPHDLRVRAWNRSGQSQPMEPTWNPSGYMRNVVESVKVIAV